MNKHTTDDALLSRTGATAQVFLPAEAQRPFAPVEPPKPARKRIESTVFKWRDPATLPRREWLYPRTYVRKFITATIAPGGIGKTGLTISECLAMATGRDLLQDGYRGDPLRVWFWNGEDPFDELERQVHAAMMHYNIGPDDIGDRLRLDSGRDLAIKLARMTKDGPTVDTEMVDAITDHLRDKGIDVAIFDPLVTMHSVSENSNDGMDLVATACAQIANDAGIALGLVMHTRKPASGITSEISSDDARGAGAVVAKARITRVLNRMTTDEAARAGIEGDARKRYFRVGHDKINLTPPEEDKSWRYLESEYLPNGPTLFEGDNMRVVSPWRFPSSFDNVTTQHVAAIQAAIQTPPSEGEHWRHDVQSQDWAGHLVGTVCGIDTSEKVGKQQAKTILKAWIENGVLKIEQRHCKSARRDKPCVVRGDAL